MHVQCICNGYAMHHIHCTAIAYGYTRFKCIELSALQHCNDTLQHTALQHAATQRVCCRVLHMMQRNHMPCNAIADAMHRYNAYALHRYTAYLS